MMSEELGVRSEELVRSLRSCADCCGKCSECAYEMHKDCAGDMKRDAADEIERLRAERGERREERGAELTANEYQRLAMRTKSSYHAENDPLINAALGLCGESGEVADLLKKYLYQGHVLDDERMVMEIGDVLWYAALAADAMGMTLGEIMQRNIEKLKNRYPDGFSEERSRNRA